MLYSKLSDCIYCNDISTLINDIDCKVVEVSKSLYNNTYFIEKRSIFCWYKENKDFITLDECELYLLKNLKYKDKIIIKYV